MFPSSAAATHSYRHSASITPSSCNVNPFAQGWQGCERQPPRRMRRLTSGDISTSLQSAAGNERSSPDACSVDDPKSPLRPRSSWIKRLSIVSQGSSHNSSQRSASPSVSCSNGSISFSHDGSTAPFVGRREPFLPPNKLVKRSSSLRIGNGLLDQVQGSRRPTFRRPATSHQRSATFHYHAVSMEATAEEPYMAGSAAVTPEDVSYTQFFRAKVPRNSIGSKKRGSPAENGIIKRIYPDGKYQPTLVLAKHIKTSGPDFDETSSRGGDSIYLESRPATPLGIDSVFSQASSFPSWVDSSLGHQKDNSSVSHSRRSFSLGDIFSLGSNSSKVSNRSHGTKLTRRASRRSSTALHALGSRLSDTARGESERPARQHEIPDPKRGQVRTSCAGPSFSQQVHTVSSADSSSEARSRQSQETGDAANTSSPPTTQRGSLNDIDNGQKPTVPSPTSIQYAGERTKRYSVTPSEPASTLVGSDTDARGLVSGDEEDLDFQSDTVYDSLRTRGTRSTSGACGPRIETIFDESPPLTSTSRTSGSPSPMYAFDNRYHGSQTGAVNGERDCGSTPRRIGLEERVPTKTVHASASSLIPPAIPSSPPDMPKPLNLGMLAWDGMAEDDDSRWSFDDDCGWDHEDVQLPMTHVATSLCLRRSNPRLLDTPGPSPSSKHLFVDPGEKDKRSSIFDWSEKPSSDKSPGTRTPPRPKTVHGKKDTDGRGSRSLGRRVPSGLHARSQSVPVVPDLFSNRSAVVTNKFGTWGVGSKGVTEDWNDDFDFSEPTDTPAEANKDNEQRIDSGLSTMVVPKSIREQQSNVLANIGLLREWGLLIEELKELRIRAQFLGILSGPYLSVWQEVDAMIDLADQEADEVSAPPQLSPSSSPGIDLGEFEEFKPPSPATSKARRRPSFTSKPEISSGSNPFVPPSQPRRKTIFDPHQDIFSKTSHITGDHDEITPNQPKPLSTGTRPRKNSEAVALSVIEALQKRKSTSGSLNGSQPPSPTKKVPFDTATLRHIVPYVNGLMRKVKEVMREAEGLYSSPIQSPKQPPLSQIFHTTDNELATQMKLMTVM